MTALCPTSLLSPNNRGADHPAVHGRDRSTTTQSCIGKRTDLRTIRVATLSGRGRYALAATGATRLGVVGVTRRGTAGPIADRDADAGVVGALRSRRIRAAGIGAAIACDALLIAADLGRRADTRDGLIAVIRAAATAGSARHVRRLRHTGWRARWRSRWGSASFLLVVLFLVALGLGLGQSEQPHRAAKQDEQGAASGMRVRQSAHEPVKVFGLHARLPRRVQSTAWCPV
jgi:hypothetical protein